ncbi:MAG: alpha/beta fold hydrolase, partial [Verrucomicrobiota bacterium]
MGQSRKRKLLFLLLGCYLLLLAVSHLVRLFDSETGTLLEGQQRVELAEWDRDQETGKTIELAYRDLTAHTGADAPVLVLIHGSPLASRAMDDLIPALQEHYRLIVPDLPGFGGSTLEVEDYSTRTHARNTLDLLDHLGISDAHFLGYSQGGGVILNVADLAPERVESLIMLSAIGVQELELLGDYTLNHGLYGLQLLTLQLVQEGFPHFGVMDDALINVSYARNFWDTDQRPLRPVLERYAGPMLIIHGTDDTLVPLAAAREHARIVPQSELVELDGGHLFPFAGVDPGDTQATTDQTHTFIQKVEKGVGKVKADVSPQRLAQSLEDMPASKRAATGETYWFYMILFVLGTQLAEDLTCVAAGLLASRGIIGFWSATAACIVGIFIGDMLLYLAGRYLGRRALSKAPLKWFIKESDVNRMQTWFHRRGAVIILGSRFVPGSRLPAYFSAGVLHIPMRKFIFYFMLAAVIWTPILVGLAYYLGDAFLGMFARFEHYAIFGLLGLIAGILLLVHVVVPMFTWRGRRRLYGKFRRLVRWEYWPRSAFYPPIALYVIGRGLLNRHLAIFTVTNPNMGDDSGFTGESKSEILTKLAGAGDAIAEWTSLSVHLPLEDKLARLQSFMQEADLDFPIVLKPDIGERGTGVAIIRSEEAACDYLQRCPETVIAQRYVEGLEYGIFYVRMPWEEQGFIFGITDKCFTQVVGDGTSTLETLILRDNRAVCMRRFF